MTDENFIIIEDENNALLEPFSHVESWDPDAVSKIYSPLKIGKVSNEFLIQSFVNEILEEDYVEKIYLISDKKATILLRQMAMFEISSNNKKTRVYNSSEAKLASQTLISFMGKDTEFFTNVLSIDHPHDNPGRVLTEDSDGIYDSISFWAINKKYFVFINQVWNHRGG